MSGITFSLGRSAPGAFQPAPMRVKKKYQGYNGGGTSSFRGLHDTSQSVLTPDPVEQWTGLQKGVILVTQVPIGTPDTSRADTISLNDDGPSIAGAKSAATGLLQSYDDMINRIFYPNIPLATLAYIGLPAVIGYVIGGKKGAGIGGALAAVRLMW